MVQENRSIAVLLKILQREAIKQHSEKCVRGLCLVSRDLAMKHICTRSEVRLIVHYIKNHRNISLSTSYLLKYLPPVNGGYFFWKDYDDTVNRLAWLRQLIKHAKKHKD